MNESAFRISVDIAASPEVVWQVMRDAERWHEWTAAGLARHPSPELPGVFGWVLARMSRNITNRYLGMEASGLKKRSEQRERKMAQH